MLIQVSVAMLASISMTAWTFDYGVLWLARSQAQTAADAAALAAAIWLGYDDKNNLVAMDDVAIAAASANPVWSRPATIEPDDVDVIPCPGGAPEDVCIRAEVFRTAARGTQNSNGVTTGGPIETLLSGLFGVLDQDIQASAVARVRSTSGTANNCLAPFAIPDRWYEKRTANKALSPMPSQDQAIQDWRMTNTYMPEFNMFCGSNTCSGGLTRGDPLTTPDDYIWPSGWSQYESSNAPPTGYRYNVSPDPLLPNDKGTFYKGGGGGGVGPMTFSQTQYKPKRPDAACADPDGFCTNSGPLRANDFHKLDLCRQGTGYADNPNGCTGGTTGQTGGEGPENARYQANIETCNNGAAINVGQELPVQQLYHRDFLEEIRHGLQCLAGGQASGVCSPAVHPSFPGDPNATWDYTTNSIKGGCKASGTCIGTDGKPSTKSPREIAVALFDPEFYDTNRYHKDSAGNFDGAVRLRVTNIVGFFVSENVYGQFDVERNLHGFFIPYQGQAAPEPGSGVVEITLIR
jgi:hypothetical protein